MTFFFSVIIYDDKGVSKMEVYVELTYCMNGILFIMTYEMISLLLNINWSFLKILFLSFLSNISIVLIYIDYLPYISFLYWIVLFLFIFKKQFFLYFPVFLIVYFSILFFINTLIKESFIYNGILITPISYKNLVIIVITFLFLIIQSIYLTYTKRKIKHQNYLYDVILFQENKTIYCKGFLDSGNEAYYKGYPLIFIKKSILYPYKQIDQIQLEGIKKRKIDILLIDSILVNQQKLDNVYIGVLDDLKYDCLLNQELMGGVI